VASGVYTQHVIEKVRVMQRLHLRKLPVLLFAAFLISPALSPDYVRAGPPHSESQAQTAQRA
jgi:hypothetical protein